MCYCGELCKKRNSHTCVRTTGMCWAFNQCDVCVVGVCVWGGRQDVCVGRHQGGGGGGMIICIVRHQSCIPISIYVYGETPCTMCMERRLAFQDLKMIKHVIVYHL